jgi:twitching motility protein PilT
MEQLYNELVVGSSHGMHTMERSLASLVQAGTIAADAARARCLHPEELDRLIG